MHLLKELLRDEVGFIVSAELVLIGTILVIGLVVGLVEVQNAVIAELNDVADSIGSVNQSFFYSGSRSQKENGLTKARFAGSSFLDHVDACDRNECDLTCDDPRPEEYKVF